MERLSHAGGYRPSDALGGGDRNERDVTASVAQILFGQDGKKTDELFIG